ncbi:hypothetical protein D9611_001221 [Ephemerocybe angulata]|uniref:Uncharacterized protein n=1 Tax=Ephemerocybe angulata TaxID=980116 RepID=A0A8H5CJ88_9AGAR|nr:hypothetical protein D9611_001221 [Tulosesus angulatus]
MLDIVLTMTYQLGRTGRPFPSPSWATMEPNAHISELGILSFGVWATSQQSPAANAFLFVFIEHDSLTLERSTGRRGAQPPYLVLGLAQTDLNGFTHPQHQIRSYLTDFAIGMGTCLAHHRLRLSCSMSSSLPEDSRPSTFPARLAFLERSSHAPELGAN